MVFIYIWIQSRVSRPYKSYQVFLGLYIQLQLLGIVERNWFRGLAGKVTKVRVSSSNLPAVA